MGTYWPVLKEGFFDSVDPGSLMGVLLFFILMMTVPQRIFRAVWGGIFILSLTLSVSLISLGYWDDWLMKEWIDVFWDVAYLLLIAFFIVLSFILLRDWQICRRESGPQRLWLRFKDSDAPSSRSMVMKAMQLIFGVAFFALAGVGLAIVEAAWPSSIFRMFLFHQELLPATPMDSLILYLLYSLSLGWLLWLVWGWFSFGKIAEKLRSQDQKFLQKFRIVVGGIFLGFALALVTYYI